MAAVNMRHASENFLLHLRHLYATGFTNSGNYELSTSFTCTAVACAPAEHETEEVIGLLVRLGFDVTVFAPASYQRRSLRRPSGEI